jgi:radical SAM superfamily enzyme YgiQ (UPF0313 family)
MKILFTYYPLFVRFSHACTLLTAVCREAGVDADYAPCTEARFEDWDVVGFSFVTDADYLASIPYIRKAKAKGKMVIAGGVYARRGGRIEGTDFVFRGEGENFVANPHFWRVLDMLISRDVHDQTLPGFVRPTIDGLPSPDLSHVTGYEFHRDQWWLMGKKIIPYQSSRGCWWGRCSFCEVRNQDNRLRISHTIVEDVNLLVDSRHPDLIYLMDTTIPYCVPEWRDQWKHVYFPFQGYIRADIRPDDLMFLIDHGLWSTAFGVESANEKFRNDTLKKGVTDEQLMATVDLLQRHNVYYVPFFMSGVPGEPPDSAGGINAIIRRIRGYPMVWKYAPIV